MALGEKGQDWTKEQVELCVAAYLEHLNLDIENITFNKAELYRTLGAQLGRTPKSIERKFQNISAVLNLLGREWISGLPPLSNFQRLLAETLEDHLKHEIRQESLLPRDGLEDLAAFYVEEPPVRAATPADLPEYMKSLVRKFDPVERDMRNRELGYAGEALVFEHEKRLLIGGGRSDLAKNVRWVSKEEGDGAGYDILSFDTRGEKRFVEVKTTIGGNTTPFFISRNEHQFAAQNVDNFCLFRVFNFRKEPRAFELNGPLERFLRLSTETYRADFQA